MKKIEYINILGNASISNNEFNHFSFEPNDPIQGIVQNFRRRGTAQQMSDGSFEFIPKPDYHSKAKQIKKLAHGRISDTKDGAILLTLKVYKDEGINIGKALLEESVQAVDGLIEYQLKN